MLYKNKDLPKGSLRKPFVYSNFVSTIDGKVQVLNNWESYWPIGSKNDHNVLTELRALSDVLIHGSGLAKLSPLVTKVQNPTLVRIRKALKKNETLPYVVLSNHPDKNLISHLQNYQGGKAHLITNKSTSLPESSEQFVNVVRVGKDKIVLKELITFLTKRLKARRILMEGGPTLFGSFLEEGLIDELFLTLSPKIFGNEEGKTLTLVEKRLFKSENIKNLRIVSSKQQGSELFLRYRILK